MDFFPAEIIRKKRDGNPLTKTEITQFVNLFVSGKIPDYQMSALLMAIFYQGMNSDEMVTLVDVMKNSGTVLQFDDVPGFKIDKHSTGGVGDKISLILAPLLACFDLVVPMISGRGLAHSGGTLDKLESIPGLNTKISLSKFKSVLKEVGFVIAGQTDELVPADRKIYALRDSTATIESLPLVVASILSKKLAEDLDGLILDVKTGKGAFFSDKDKAIQVASNLISVGEDFGVKVKALLTNMDQPIGFASGNWIEVVEAVQFLQGNGPKDTMELVYNLALKALKIAGFKEKNGKLKSNLKTEVENGKDFEKFEKYVNLMGGDTAFVQNINKFPLKKPIQVKAKNPGFISNIDAYQIGVSAMFAGAGRKNSEDKVDPGAGIRLFFKVGDFVHTNDILAEIYTEKTNSEVIAKKVKEAIVITSDPPDEQTLIYGEITRDGKLIQF